MRTVPTALLACLVVLAGCAGAFGGDPQTASPTPTVGSETATPTGPTPTPTATATATPDPTATATPDPYPELSDERVREFRNFTAAVERRALRPVESWTFRNESMVEARLPSAAPYEQYYDRHNDTFVEAAAQVMAAANDASETPRRIIVRTESNNGYIGVSYRFNRSLALALAEYEMTAEEFGRRTDPNTHYSSFYQNGTTYVVHHSKDEVRSWYASALERNLSLEHATVLSVKAADSNASVRVGNSTHTDIPVVLTIRTTRTVDNYSTEQNEFFRIDKSIAEAWNKTAVGGPYVTEPKILKVIYIDHCGELFQVQRIPTFWVKAWMQDIIHEVRYVWEISQLMEEYNGGRESKYCQKSS